MSVHSISLRNVPSFPPSIAQKSHLSSSPSPNAALFLKFRTAHREKLRYLRALGIIDPQTKPHKLPSPDAVDSVLATVNFLKSKGFSDSDFSRLAFLCPKLFSQNFDITDIVPVFDFLAVDLSASIQESHGLILRCPQILFSDVEFCLRPTLNFLKQLGIENLKSPSNLNSHLLNTRVEKLKTKIGFLQSTGLSHADIARICARMPAILGYSVEDNLRPKFEYLVRVMERSLEELEGFPQYFAFSLQRRIAPRHIHLKQRNVRLPLNRMLLSSDDRFFAKWK